MGRRKFRLRLPSAATVIATLALLAATAGGATAAVQRLITGAQVKNGSLTGADVKDKSLTARDFRGALRGARGVRGAEGPPGPQGAQGPKGDKGDPGSVGGVTTVEADVVVAPAGAGVAAAPCPAGQLTVSGGFHTVDGLVLWDVSRATAGRTQWVVAGLNISSTAPATIRAVAYCAVLPSAGAVSAAAERADLEALRKQFERTR